MNVIGRICGWPQDDYLSDNRNPPLSFSQLRQQVDEKHIKTLLPLSAKTKYYTENDSHSAKSPPLNNAVEKGDLMPFLEGDIVDAPTHHLDESKGKRKGGWNDLLLFYFLVRNPDVRLTCCCCC